MPKPVLNVIVTIMIATAKFSFHSLCFNSEIMAALCHSMTFTLPSLTMTTKITSVLKSESCRLLGSCQHPSHSLSTTLVLVCFYYPATVLDPHTSLFLFLPSRADTNKQHAFGSPQPRCLQCHKCTWL